MPCRHPYCYSKLPGVCVCRFGNAISLWLGMQPAEVFFYVFLPPLLLDSAVRVDYFLFKKVIPDLREDWGWNA